MSSNTARAEEQTGDGDGESWPPGVSRVPTMSIGSALGILQREFPAASVSKIRFLEEQGLVSPRRTPSGYRSYSQSDVERLRFVLAAQRDSFLPLKVIRDRLAELDAGLAAVSPPGARVVTEDGDLVVAAGRARYTTAQLAEASGRTEADIEALVKAGVLVADAGGKFPGALVPVAKFAGELAEQGIDERHLRAIRIAAERQVDLIEQVIAPVRSVRSGPSSTGARARAESMAADLAETLAQVHTAILRAGADRLT
ncbi:MerR family transcriptional regulator [Pseudactinotalea sp. Z1748]|uniref:transcriptional regulator FtsR n=1 Tax=Pseudactinotalea sp. Z1748 TaxID=3413027 RepID=UPI003C7D9189